MIQMRHIQGKRGRAAWIVLRLSSLAMLAVSLYVAFGWLECRLAKDALIKALEKSDDIELIIGAKGAKRVSLFNKKREVIGIVKDMALVRCLSFKKHVVYARLLIFNGNDLVGHISFFNGRLVSVNGKTFFAPFVIGGMRWK